MTDFCALCAELANMLAQYASLPGDPEAVALLRHARAALSDSSQSHTTSPMTYALSIGPWQVGPFPTAFHAQHWAERYGVNDWNLIEMDDPCEAPAVLALMREVPPGDW